MDSLKQFGKKVLKYEAALILTKYKPKIIAIIGSVGKTTTKEAIYLVLSKNFFIRKSEKSFTNEIGIPLTIIGGSFDVGKITWIKNLILGFGLILKKSIYPEWII